MRLLFPTFMICLSLQVFGSSQEPNGFFIESARYEDFIYSSERKTELGDQSELEMDFRYQFAPETHATFSFETLPEANRFNSKTSRFEFGLFHQRQGFELAADLELLTDDRRRVSGSQVGILSLGLDVDSSKTYIAYTNPDQWFKFAFYPFNFDGRVGDEFGTYDVTRLFFIEGAPSTVSPTQLANEKIGEKTIPGFVFSFYPGAYSIDVGLGAASYLYPANSNFDIRNNAGADRWERREAVGYKLGFGYSSELIGIRIDQIMQTRSEETGALLESAASLNLRAELGSFLVRYEATMSKAGGAPWRIDQESEWFDQVAPFQPIYADTNSNLQDWIGKADSAHSLQVGMQFEDFLPYLLFRVQGEHFVFNERESAHILRNADETLSHGGLERFGLGAVIEVDEFQIIPEIEFLNAKNPVFTNSSDVRDDRRLGSFKKKDIQLTLELTYAFDEQDVFGL